MLRQTDRGAGAPEWAVDLSAAAALAAATFGLWLAAGGVWDYANGGDLHADLLPRYLRGAQSVIGDGRLPLWNAFEFCGMPLFGAALGAALYPPVPILFTLLSPWWALQGLFATSTFLIAFGLLSYLRWHGVGRPAAIIATPVVLATVMRGFFHAGVDHPHFAAGVAWFAMSLAVAERAGAHGGIWIPTLALASAISWLVGNPELPMDALILIPLVTVMTTSSRAHWRSLARIGCGLGLGLALAAIQLLPLAELVAQSQRAEMQSQYAGWRQTMDIATLTNLPPDCVDRFGVAALLLAGVALWRPRRAAVGWSLAFVWCVFALHWPLDQLYRLPPFDGVRFAFGWSYFAGVWLGCLAAEGAQRLWRRERPGPQAIAVALALASMAHGWSAVAGAPGSLPSTNLPREAFHVPDYDVIARRAMILQVVQKQSGAARVLSEREWVSGAPLRLGLRSPTGHEPSVLPARIAHLLEDVGLFDATGANLGRDWPGLLEHPAIGARLGLGLVTVPVGREEPYLHAGFHKSMRLPLGDIILVKPSLPRARIVHEVRTAPTADASRTAVLDPEIDPTTTAVIESMPQDVPVAPPPAGASERVAVVTESDTEVVVEADVAAAAVLVLSDTYFPGWHATIDGYPAPIYAADHAFRGVPVAGGRHRIVFAYAPASLQWGERISTIAAGLVAALLLLPGARASYLRERIPEGRVGRPSFG